MSTSQLAQLAIMPESIPRGRAEKVSDAFEPTIGLKEISRILNCSAEQCRRLALAKKIPVFRIGCRWKSTVSAIVNWREEQLALMRHSRPPEER